MFDIVLQCYDRLRLITYRSMFRHSIHKMNLITAHAKN